MKIKLSLFSLLILSVIVACAPSIIITENDETEKENLQCVKIVEPAIVNRSNPYFFKNKDIKQFYEDNFIYKMEAKNILVNNTINDVYETEIYLSVKHLKELDNGDIYELKFKKPIEVDLEKYRFDIGIFYINKTHIYRLTDISYEKIKNLEREDEILCNEDNYIIVCQEEEIEDNFNLTGQHNFLDSDGNIRIFRSYNSQVETGFYERLVWSRDLGLVGFLSGFGAECETINITLNDTYKKYTSSTITW